tara:strand:- start:816 stop:1934 length:1119 start_codon:yes stop_codon:yes gene_type:complete
MKNNKKMILICSNYAWTILNFRMGLIKELKRNGYKVAVITQYDGHEAEISKEVDIIFPLFISRKGINPVYDLMTFFHLLINVYRLKPDFLLLFTIKPVIYGSMVGRLLRIRSYSMITGLGTAFLSKSWITKLVKILYKKALSKSQAVFFQNSDDRDIFLSENLVNENVIRMVPGSGIDLSKFPKAALIDKDPMVFTLISRMLWDKGIKEFVEAAEIIKRSHPEIIFQLVGPLNVENRSAIPEKKMNEWIKDENIKYLGETNDVTKFLKDSSCIVLPSYREGTSRVLLEAASMCRPIITTNVPGCREVVEDGYNGLLCESKNTEDLVKKIQKMILLTFDERQRMGLNGRVKMENNFDQSIVSRIYLEAIKHKN